MLDENVEWTNTTNSNVVAQEIDGDVLIIDVALGNYYSLNGVAAKVWELLSEPRRLPDLVKIIREAYIDTPDDVTLLLEDFLADLATEQLVTQQSAPANPNQHAAPTSRAVAERGSSFQKPILEKYTDMQALLLIDPIHDVDELGWPVTATRA